MVANPKCSALLRLASAYFVLMAVSMIVADSSGVFMRGGGDAADRITMALLVVSFSPAGPLGIVPVIGHLIGALLWIRLFFLAALITDAASSRRFYKMFIIVLCICLITVVLFSMPLYGPG